MSRAAARHGTESAPPRPVAHSPFRSRNFRWYWAGGFISNIGTWLQNVSGSVFVLAQTHSTLYVGLLNLATFIPIVIFSVPAGVLADRYERRGIVITTSALSVVFAGVIAVAAATENLSAWLLIAMAFCIGSAYAINKPAMTALLPAVAPESDIAHAAAINTLQFNLGQVFGASLSALLLALTSYTFIFAVNALSFLGPIGAMLMLRLGTQASVVQVARRGSGREGARFVLRSPVILTILGAVALSNASVECVRTMAPAVSTRILHAAQSSTGVLVTGVSAGACAGVLGFAFVTRRISGRVLLVATFALQIVGLVGMALSRAVWLSTVLAVPIGLGYAINIPILSGALLRLSPDDFRGRVMSFYNMAMIGIRPVFSVTAGALGAVLNPAVVLVVFVAFPVIAIRLTGMTSRALEQSGAAT